MGNVRKFIENLGTYSSHLSACYLYDESSVVSENQQAHIPMKEILEICNYANRKVGRVIFSASPFVVKNLGSILKSLSVDEVKAVIDSKWDEWRLNKEMRVYFRATTLFGQNFNKYYEDSIASGHMNKWLKKLETTTNHSISLCVVNAENFKEDWQSEYRKRHIKKYSNIA